MSAARVAPVPRTTRLSREERRASILGAATGAFATAGYGATSINELAAAAGVTPLILYRHFESKEHLYSEVIQQATQRQRSAVAAATDAQYGIDAAVLLSAAREDPAAFTVVWRHAVREPAFAKPTVQLRRFCADRVRASLVDQVEDELVRWAAEATVGYLIEAVLTWLDFGTPTYDRRFAEATDAAMRAGIRAWTKSPTTSPAVGGKSHDRR